MRASTCSSCKALIVWAVSSNGKPIPIDAKPLRNGNLELEPASDPREPPVAHVLDKNGERETGFGRKAPMLRYQTHFVTCPDSAAFRKP